MSGNRIAYRAGMETSHEHLALRAWAERLQAAGWSWMIFYMDLVAAFDTVIRQAVLGLHRRFEHATMAEREAEAMRQLSRLKVSEPCRRWVSQYLARTDGLIAEMDIPQWVRHTLKE